MKIDVIGASVAYTKKTIKYRTMFDKISACSNSNGSANGRIPRNVCLRSFSVNFGPTNDRKNAVATADTLSSSTLNVMQVFTNKI